MATTTANRDKIMYVTYSDASGNLVSYHLGVALENQNIVLQSDADCLGNGGGCVNTGGGSFNSNYSASFVGSGNPAATSSISDFGGNGSAEGAGGVCRSTLSTCIYDIVPQ